LLIIRETLVAAVFKGKISGQALFTFVATFYAEIPAGKSFTI
jgi:hypothetical protein